MCHFVKYDDIVADPEKEFRKIYDFLEEPYYSHRFIDLDQININGLFYNDDVLGNNMHTVKKEKAEKTYNSYIEKIPKSIRERYGHIKI